MSLFRKTLIGAACLTALASFESCTRSADSTSPSSSGKAGSTVGDDMKDIGRATADLADKAGKRIEKAANDVGVSGDDAWITTKVKSELTMKGFDLLHVHVDTAGKVVTLSGTVETAADKHKAVDLAKAVKGVVGVEDHLFVKPDHR